MSFDAGAITGSIGLDLSDYAHGILEAQTISQVFPQIVTEFLEEPLLAVIQIAKEAGDAIKEMLFGISEAQHGVAQTAEALGVSIEFLDGWRKSAERVGVQADEVNQALTFMSRSVAAAAKDSTDPAAKAYAQLGISVTDAAGRIKPVEQLAREVADALHNMAGGAERTGLAMEIFGRGGASAISFFSQGSRAIDDYVEKLRQMGDLTTEESAKSAMAFNEAWVEMTQAWDGLKEQFAEPIRETITPMIKELLAGVQRHAPEIKELFHDMGVVIKAALEVVFPVLEKFLHYIAKIIEAYHAVKDFFTGSSSGNGDTGGTHDLISESMASISWRNNPASAAVGSIITSYYSPPNRSGGTYIPLGDGSGGGFGPGDDSGFGDDGSRRQAVAANASQSTQVHIHSLQVNAPLDARKIADESGKKIQEALSSRLSQNDSDSNVRRQARGRAD